MNFPVSLSACLLVAAAAMAPALAQTTTPERTGVQPTLPVPAASEPAPARRWTDVQIRQSFEAADADGNGELTRAEAQRAGTLPRSFEDIDRNKDGVLVFGEYESAFPR